ncbi:uncharacterized protein LOC131877856 [Tigriopus californicus]|uniref:uncharacterized protein LOC131877856 n=1 Tax=Tigriopus californicus TaxID=6832 RepID=UPI0027DA4758|nr:uncharacterized protein LOC131877856 [Tigriopus californicus]
MEDLRRRSNPSNWTQSRISPVPRSRTPNPGSFSQRDHVKLSLSSSVPSKLYQLGNEDEKVSIKSDKPLLLDESKDSVDKSQSAGLSRTQSLGTLSQSEVHEGHINEARRDDLLEKYYHYQKERREIRRRNIQAQVNIAQYFRKHQMNMFPSDHERSQTSLKDEYQQVLKRIEQLTSQKDQETISFQTNMELISVQRNRVRREIASLEREMVVLKTDGATATAPSSTGKTVTAKDVADQMKTLAYIEEDMGPVRFEHAKLKRKLDWLQKQWSQVKQHNQHGSHAVELNLENSIFLDRIHTFDDEYEKLQSAMDNDIALLTLTKMKQAQLKANNDLKERELDERKRISREVSACVCDFIVF